MSTAQKLKTVMHREVDCLQQLLDILGQEHEALLASDIDTIELVTATKHRALATQNEATLSRQAVMSESFVGNTDEALRQLIASYENQDDLGDLLLQLRTLAQQCSTANRANGRLIMQKQQQARSALNIIRQTAGSTPTYSGHGKTTAAHATRSLGKA